MQTYCKFAFLLLTPQSIAQGFNRVIVAMVPAVAFKTFISVCSVFAFLLFTITIQLLPNVKLPQVLGFKELAHLRAWHGVHWFMDSPCRSVAVLTSTAAEFDMKMYRTFSFYPFLTKCGRCFPRSPDAQPLVHTGMKKTPKNSHYNLNQPSFVCFFSANVFSSTDKLITVLT